MRVLDRLDDLDRKVLGVGREENPRHWWRLLLSGFVVAVFVVADLVHGARRWAVMFVVLTALCSAFRAGAMYEASLRNRGLRFSWRRGRLPETTEVEHP